MGVFQGERMKSSWKIPKTSHKVAGGFDSQLDASMLFASDICTYIHTYIHIEKNINNYIVN